MRLLACQTPPHDPHLRSDHVQTLYSEALQPHCFYNLASHRSLPPVLLLSDARDTAIAARPDVAVRTSTLHMAFLTVTWVTVSLQAAEALERWEADRPNLLHFVAALTETRGIMRAEVTRLQEVSDGARSARPTVTGGARTGFNVIQVLVAQTASSRASGRRQRRRFLAAVTAIRRLAAATGA